MFQDPGPCCEDRAVSPLPVRGGPREGLSTAPGVMATPAHGSHLSPPKTPPSLGLREEKLLSDLRHLVDAEQPG